MAVDGAKERHLMRIRLEIVWCFTQRPGAVQRHTKQKLTRALFTVQ